MAVLKTNRPLAIPMIMMGMFSIIVVAAGIYSVIVNFKQDSVGQTESKIPSKKSQKVIGKKGSSPLGRASLSNSVISALTNSMRNRNRNSAGGIEVEELPELRPETKQFLEDFEDYDKLTITDEVGPFATGPFIAQVEYGDEQVFQKTTDDPSSPAFIKTARIVNTFGVLGSDGVVGYYSANGPIASGDDFTGNEYKISKYNLNVEGLDCHIEVRCPAGYTGEAFEEENLLGLVDNLYNTREWKFELLQNLNVPDRFVIFVGVLPDQSQNLPLIHKVKWANTNYVVVILSNVFRKVGTDGIFIAQDLDLSLMSRLREKSSKIFDSLHKFREFVGSFGMENIEHDKISTQEFDFTAHFASSDKKKLQNFKQNGPEIVMKILDGCKDKNLIPQKTAILIIFDQFSKWNDGIRYDVKSFIDSEGNIKKLEPIFIETEVADTEVTNTEETNTANTDGDEDEDEEIDSEDDIVVIENDNEDKKLFKVSTLGIEKYEIEAENSRSIFDSIIDDHTIYLAAFDIETKKGADDVEKNKYYFRINSCPPGLFNGKVMKSEKVDEIKPTLEKFADLEKNHVKIVEVGNYYVYFRGTGYNLSLFSNLFTSFSINSFENYARKLVSFVNDDTDIFDKFEEFVFSASKPFKLTDENLEIEILIVEK